MPIDPHKINVHSAGQTQRHVAMTILKDKYPNFKVGLKCFLTVNPYLIVCSYIK